METYDVDLVMHVFNVEAYKRRVQNRPIQENLNPAYETWAVQERRRRESVLEGGDIEFEANRSYGRREDVILHGRDFPSHDYENVL